MKNRVCLSKNEIGCLIENMSDGKAMLGISSQDSISNTTTRQRPKVIDLTELTRKLHKSNGDGQFAWPK